MWKAAVTVLGQRGSARLCPPSAGSPWGQYWAGSASFIEQQEVPRYCLKSHLNLYLELLVLRPSRDKQRAAGLRALGEEVRVNGLCADGVHEELGEGSLLRPAVSQSPQGGGQCCGPGLLAPGTAVSSPVHRAADRGGPAWRNLTERPAHHQHRLSWA